MNGESRADQPPEQTYRELAALLRAAARSELSSSGFSDRLTRIHTRRLGEDADTRTNEARRVKALRAFENLTREATSRHHELELLAETLGVTTS